MLIPHWKVSLVQEVLAALRIPVVEKEGYEADDVIATLTDPGPRRRACRC